jgi:hypothetical protein
MARHSDRHVVNKELIERFLWVRILKERAITRLPKDDNVATFPAPRASVAKLCDIAQAAVELVQLTDQNHDDHSPEGARAAKKALDKLIEVLK